MEEILHNTVLLITFCMFGIFVCNDFCSYLLVKRSKVHEKIFPVKGLQLHLKGEHYFSLDSALKMASESDDQILIQLANTYKILNKASLIAFILFMCGLIVEVIYFFQSLP